MRMFGRKWCGGAGMLAASLVLTLLTGTASAQSKHEGGPHTWPSSLPSEELRIGPEKSLWSGQLKMARQFGARALVGLRNTPMAESATVEDQVLQAARDNYMLLRSAKQGMEIFSGKQKYPDPVMDLALKRVTAAWNLARTPVDRYTWAISRQEYLTDSIHDLDESIRLLDQALVLIP